MRESLFVGRTLVIATQHQKEKVIAPALEAALGVHCIVPEQFDSDRFGTFSGEIPRIKTPLETARDKCIAAMQQSGCALGIASEGSFGPHPTLGFLPFNEEWLLLLDTRHQLEIVAREWSTDSNFSQRDISSFASLLDFAQKIGFPEHRLILRAGDTCWKGIGAPEELARVYDLACASGQDIRAETDMRAMYNPTRMQVIAKAVGQLLTHLQSECPGCGMPGFVVTSTEAGLPCSLCNSPTRAPLRSTRQCKHCPYSDSTLFPQGKIHEDPEYCDYCNP